MTRLECLRILDVPANASQKDIVTAYRHLVQVWHPDRFAKNPELHVKANQKLSEINEAYSILIEGKESTTESSAAHRDEQVFYLGRDPRLKPRNGEVPAIIEVIPEGMTLVTISKNQADEVACYSRETLVAVAVGTERWIRRERQVLWSPRSVEDVVGLYFDDPQGILTQPILVILKLRNSYFAQLLLMRLQPVKDLEKWMPSPPPPKPTPPSPPPPNPVENQPSLTPYTIQQKATNERKLASVGRLSNDHIGVGVVGLLACLGLFAAVIYSNAKESQNASVFSANNSPIIPVESVKVPSTITRKTALANAPREVAHTASMKSPDEIVIANPASNAQEVFYSLNEYPYSMKPGTFQRVKNDRNWTISVNDGDGRIVKYTLSHARYEFKPTDSGVELYFAAQNSPDAVRSVASTAIDPTLPTLKSSLLHTKIIDRTSGAESVGYVRLCDLAPAQSGFKVGDSVVVKKDLKVALLGTSMEAGIVPAGTIGRIEKMGDKIVISTQLSTPLHEVTLGYSQVRPNITADRLRVGMALKINVNGSTQLLDDFGKEIGQLKNGTAVYVARP